MMTNKETLIAMAVDDTYQELRETGMTWDQLLDRLSHLHGKRGYKLWIQWERKFSGDRQTQRAEQGYAA